MHRLAVGAAIADDATWRGGRKISRARDPSMSAHVSASKNQAPRFGTTTNPGGPLARSRLVGGMLAGVSYVSILAPELAPAASAMFVTRAWRAELIRRNSFLYRRLARIALGFSRSLPILNPLSRSGHEASPKRFGSHPFAGTACAHSATWPSFQMSFAIRPSSDLSLPASARISCISSCGVKYAVICSLRALKFFFPALPS